MKQRKQNLKTQNSSLWLYFNPMTQTYIEEIEDWVMSCPNKKFALTLFELENIAPLIFSYGDKLTQKCANGIHKILVKEFDDAFVKRISFDKYIVVHNLKIKKEKYHEKIEQVFYCIKGYGTKTKSTPVYLSLKGGSTFFEKGELLPFILDKAYIALFEVRNNATDNHAIFNENSENLTTYKTQMNMAAYFLDAIAKKRLRLAFQPVIDCLNGKVKSYEALLRIVTDKGEIISAGPFIPIAEKFSFIDIIDTFVLKLVVKELKLDNDVHIALNVSNQTVSSSKWYNLAKELLTDPKIAERLIIELTETGMEKNFKKIGRFVDNVQAFGCKVAIDDFGAGYTSFKQLKLINADILKIDGAFVRDIIENPDSRLFVKTLLEFSRAYNLKTVAEFVETGEIAKLLMELGVDYLQGYYFGQAFNYRPWIKDDSKV